MEKYTYFFVGNALPFFDSVVPEDHLEGAKDVIRTLYAVGVPSDYLELHARFNSGWLIFNPVTGEFE